MNIYEFLMQAPDSFYFTMFWVCIILGVIIVKVVGAICYRNRPRVKSKPFKKD